MPTGYTADIESGKVTDFATFAMQCARAFGATITMRDDPLDTPIPDEFEADAYYEKRLNETRAELAAIKAMSSADAAAECESENRRSREEHDKWVARVTETRNRYNAMLAAVIAWEPPSPDHQGLKDFMVQQLTESLRFDCSEPPPPRILSPADWRVERIATLSRRIESWEEDAQKEQERTEGRNRWIRQLRESLKSPEPATPKG